MTELGVVKASQASVPELWLAWSGRGLKAAWWQDDAVPVQLGDAKQAAVPAAWARLLRSYLEREPVDLSALPVDVDGTPFQRRVWGALRRIPRGEVRTYGDIARAIGNPMSMRAVGAANGANPLPVVIPCHRVVAAGGKLGGYSGGLERKRWLLRLEGVRVEGDCVRSAPAVPALAI